MLLVYAYSRRVLRVACELGLSVAVPMELLELARSLRCRIDYAVLGPDALPRDVVDARRAGARGVAVLAGEMVIVEKLCRIASILGLDCRVAHIVEGGKPEEKNDRGLILWRPSCLFLRRCLAKLVHAGHR